METEIEIKEEAKMKRKKIQKQTESETKIEGHPVTRDEARSEKRKNSEAETWQRQ